MIGNIETAEYLLSTAENLIAEAKRYLILENPFEDDIDIMDEFEAVTDEFSLDYHIDKCNNMSDDEFADYWKYKWDFLCDCSLCTRLGDLYTYIPSDYRMD